MIAMYTGYTKTEIESMSDKDWELTLCHVARIRQEEAKAKNEK